MLPKLNRLKRIKDFEEVFKKGQGYKEDFIYLKINRNNLKSTRFGFIVSKKFSKKAVMRNSLRRKISEIISNRLDGIKKGFDCIMIIRPGLKINDFWELDKRIDILFKKANLFKSK
ncbi:MAG: ribonuclease P protein component [Candidatus Pacebacteria bacterium]|nr:ribonuclease P protein component [Candidatus Paceibacterota bacterium]